MNFIQAYRVTNNSDLLTNSTLFPIPNHSCHARRRRAARPKNAHGIFQIAGTKNNRVKPYFKILFYVLFLFLAIFSNFFSFFLGRAARRAGGGFLYNRNQKSVFRNIKLKFSSKYYTPNISLIMSLLFFLFFLLFYRTLFIWRGALQDKL